MVITVQIKGNKQVSRMLKNFGPELNKQISSGSKEFLDSVRRGALLMVPRQTGQLARSMVVRPGRKKGNWIFAVGDKLQHALPVETGYRPHLVSSSAEAYPGITIADVYNIPEGIMLLVTGSRRPHFIRDAFQNAIKRLPEILARKTKKAIKRAGGVK